jgi:hypothetical protein
MFTRGNHLKFIINTEHLLKLKDNVATNGEKREESIYNLNHRFYSYKNLLF